MLLRFFHHITRHAPIKLLACRLKQLSCLTSTPLVSSCLSTNCYGSTPREYSERLDGRHREVFWNAVYLIPQLKGLAEECGGGTLPVDSGSGSWLTATKRRRHLREDESESDRLHDIFLITLAFVIRDRQRDKRTSRRRLGGSLKHRSLRRCH